MKKPILYTTLILLILAEVVFASDISWPVKREIDLASGFGDYRSGRFHAGLDIRTGGVIGEPVYSPVDGYVWRIRTHYSGYGKVLYIRGTDEHIYVFAHLNMFAPAIEKAVKNTQVSSQRYYTDIYLPEDSIKIKKGQVVAQSGETGAGPPHLHFECRSSDNRPINPLTHGFSLDDDIRPAFDRIGFQVTDDSSLMDNGLRKVFYNVKRGSGAGEYYLDTVPYFNCPFGVLVDSYDLMRTHGMRRSVRKLSLFIDDVLLYESVFDTLDYSTELSSQFEYDYTEAVEDHSKVRRLYSEYGNEFKGSRAKNGFKGYIGESIREKLGKRNGRVVAEDCCGNQAVLKFSFIWGPGEDIFHLDSATSQGFDERTCFFTALKGYENFEIDSVVVFQNSSENWFKSRIAHVDSFDSDQLICSASSEFLRPKVLRLFIYTKSGCLIRDNIFNGLIEAAPKLPSQSIVTLDDEGMWVTIGSPNKFASRAWVNLFHGDTLLGTHEARFYNMRNYRCFIRAKEEYATIDKISLVLSEKPDDSGFVIDTLRFNGVGFGNREVISKDGRLSLKFTGNTLYRPMFVQIIDHDVASKVVLRLNSDHYEILPHVFPCREDFEITYQMSGDHPKNDISGICWLDKKKDKWVWLDNTNENNVVKAKSIGGGSFAAVIDYDPPTITNLNVRANGSYFDSTMGIKFLLKDTLSGFEDDRSIVIKIDGEWVIPEYDPESYICTTEPLHPLSIGEHHLAIQVYDQVGNMAEEYRKFIIKRPANRR